MFVRRRRNTTSLGSFLRSDVDIYNQDDCIAVKRDAENMVFERITASGLGLSIGGIGHSVVQNITFRDSVMQKTVKGIYIKVVESNGGLGSITDVLYENITINKPIEWAIWIGPAQQAISANPCNAAPCSLCWPSLPGAACNCPPSAFANITLRNIWIHDPAKSPGVILANSTAPMRNIVFDNVVVTNPSMAPFGKDYYHCEHAQGIATGSTWPVPPCFEDRTDKAR
jgi:hypothetical protein